MISYYSKLNISENASEIDIKKAYRKLALEWHPDRNKSSNAKEKFIEINEAYNILIDPSKRSEYDYLFNLSKNVNEHKNQENIKEKESSFEYWKNDAKREAEYQATRPFQEFQKSLGIVAEVGFNGCAVIIGLSVYLPFPWMFFSLLNSFITHQIVEVTLGIIFLIISLIVTLLGIYVIYKLIQKHIN